MAKPDWHYFWLRDLTVLMFIFAGALGVVVAAMWIPVVWSTAAVASAAGQDVVFILLFVIPVCFMLVWALVWWAAAARRALRMRRLMRTGTSVQATVEKMKEFHHLGGWVSVALWLQYELDGQTHNIKRETSWRAVVAPARDLGRIELAVDSLSLKHVALVVDGRLG